MGMTIFEFNHGQIIKRVSPSRRYRGGIRDRSYIGEPMTFLGIRESLIVLKADSRDELLKLPIDVWLEGWEVVKVDKELTVIPLDSLKEVIHDNSNLLSQLLKVSEAYEQLRKFAPKEVQIDFAKIDQLIDSVKTQYHISK